jgi:hypothetical protein
MQTLPKYTLEYDEKKEKWELQKDQTNKIIKRFDTKQKATRGGVLEKALGKQGGSVKIQLRNGRYQEERTFPRSRDPRNSIG